MSQIASKTRPVLQVWALALAASAMLAAAGERWPDPLTIRPAVVIALLLLPPLAMLAWLAVHWRLPVEPARGETP
ncbi:MAG: hypothetical protein ACKOPN_09680 [Prochlorococcaceae cyanobacterium]